MKTIIKKYNLPFDDLPDIVHKCDKNIAFFEARELKIGFNEEEWKECDLGYITKNSDFTHIGQNPWDAETDFLSRFEELTGNKI
jgi:hypothetical protein